MAERNDHLHDAAHLLGGGGGGTTAGMGGRRRNGRSRSSTALMNRRSRSAGVGTRPRASAASLRRNSTVLPVTTAEILSS